MFLFFLYFCDIWRVISNFSPHFKIYIYLFHDFSWNYVGETLESYNVNNYVYIHTYMQSKTQQFVRWYHYVICNNK